jgi:predicted small metal-binding protein
MASNHSKSNCRVFLPEEMYDLTLAGNEEELLEATVQHAVQAHGYRDTPALREELRAMLRDERKKKAA